MKTRLLLPLLLLSAALAGAAEKIVAGPKGGRLLEVAPLQAEFFVTKDRTIEVNFYDASLKPVAPGAHVVAVTAETKSGRTPIELQPTTTGFVSKSPLPASAEAYRVVVQVRSAAGARPQNFRIDLNLAPCDGCKFAEYACTCASH
jgi:hypothetical protein